MQCYFRLPVIIVNLCQFLIYLYLLEFRQAGAAAGSCLGAVTNGCNVRQMMTFDNLPDGFLANTAIGASGFDGGLVHRSVFRPALRVD
jgi:hypothetical protein